MSKDQPATHRFSRETRDEITSRVLAGEKAAVLAAEFGTSRAYVSLLKATALDPERFKRKEEAKLLQKLTGKQIANLIEIFETSTPADHDLIPARERWTLEHGFQMAWKLFSKRPSVRAMKECMGELLTRRRDHGDPKPTPPQIKTIHQIDPELAKDPGYVAYILSPIYQQIARREYEMALADWELRNPSGEEINPATPRQEETAAGFPPSLPASLGKRAGKHSNAKGSPFTPPKVRRKKRR